MLESFDNFTKQTYRNRAYIYAANGRLQLNIPVRYTQKNRQLYKDVEIAYDTDWQLIHKRSIESAYRTSAFFEFYEDELIPIYERKEKYLYDFNLKTIDVISQWLQTDFNYKFTKKFEPAPQGLRDKRDLVNAKKQSQIKFEDYFQVFEDKHGFIENLSVLDLVCNLGPESLIYLSNVKLV